MNIWEKSIKAMVDRIKSDPEYQAKLEKVVAELSKPHEYIFDPKEKHHENTDATKI